MEDNETSTYGTESVSSVFKNLFSNLEESLLTTLPNTSIKYNLRFIVNYHPSLIITDDFCLHKTSQDKS